jgi:Zn finger protein HypA/HybF involved in hydrogenase expression
MAISECEKRGLMKPKKINIDLGGLANYKKEPILFYFDMLKKENGMIADTELEINEIAGIVKCNDCGKATDFDEPIMVFCSACKSVNAVLVKGNEFNLKSIEV